MARILTGIQSTGVPHLGNILGAILPAIELSRNSDNESLFFIADLHSFTTIRSSDELRDNTFKAAMVWLACGLNTDRTIFFKQSDVPQVTELAWYLNCLTPMPMLENAHSFKDKSEKLSKDKISAGLFTYPVLMSADILLYDADIVPVGKDQKQHLEITRDIARSFNHQFGELFVVPEAKINDRVMLIPGTDGNKMSKSYGNTIDVFLPEKALRKVVMSIQTDSTPLEEPKNPDTCTVFKLFQLLGTTAQVDEMRKNYVQGNYGYGHAKQALFELILETFKNERKAYDQLSQDPTLVTKELQKGAEKAQKLANTVLSRVRSKLGY